MCKSIRKKTNYERNSSEFLVKPLLPGQFLNLVSVTESTSKCPLPPNPPFGGLINSMIFRWFPGGLEVKQMKFIEFLTFRSRLSIEFGNKHLQIFVNQMPYLYNPRILRMAELPESGLKLGSIYSQFHLFFVHLPNLEME